MDIGFFVGHKHQLKHSQVLIDSINKFMGNCHTTVVVNDEDYGYFTEQYTSDINILTIDKCSPLPFIDKIQAAAKFEACCVKNYLWLDVDSILFDRIEFPENISIAVNNVDIKNVGNPYDETLSPLWRILSNRIRPNYTAFPAVKTLVSDETIYPYFNIGCVYVEVNKGLFSACYTNTIHILNSKEIMAIITDDPLYTIFFHQAIFTLTALNLYEYNEISSLADGINIPLHIYKRKNMSLDIHKVKSIRYDDYFNDGIIAHNLPTEILACKGSLKMAWYYD